MISPSHECHQAEETGGITSPPADQGSPTELGRFDSRHLGLLPEDIIASEYVSRNRARLPQHRPDHRREKEHHST